MLSDQKACDVVNASLEAHPGKPHLAAKAICLAAYQAESEDNISAAVLMFKAAQAASLAASSTVDARAAPAALGTMPAASQVEVVSSTVAAMNAGKKQPADPAKVAEKAEKARVAKETAARKKAEAAAARKEQAVLVAKQRAEEAAARKVAEAEQERVAAELGIGSYELKGDRGYMEDRVATSRLPAGELYAAVYDGHCGQGAAEFAKQRLHGFLVAHPSFSSDPSRALHDAIVHTNAAFCGEADDESGTTAVVALLRGNDLYVANAGDSRATICSGGVGTALTKDHKPDDPEEEERVRKAGGKCEWGRVAAPDGKNFLACARSIGDSKFKVGPPERHLICATPDVFQRSLGEAATLLFPLPPLSLPLPASSPCLPAPTRLPLSACPYPPARQPLTACPSP